MKPFQSTKTLLLLLAAASFASPAVVAEAALGFQTRSATARPVVPTDMKMAFKRLPSSVSFNVLVSLSNKSGPVCGQFVMIQSARGQISPVTELNCVYQATVTPNGTGDYTVTATSGTLSKTKTAIVLQSVSDVWGQPERVEGLASTVGYEDSIYITPNGEQIFETYSPVDFSCIYEPDQGMNSPICKKATGPWLAPQRPDLEGAAERISASGDISASCLGIPVPPAAGLPFTTYGFKRQADGSFADPFAIGVAGSGGCLVIGGVNVYPKPDGSAQMLFSFNDRGSIGNNNPAATHGNIFATLNVPAVGQHITPATWSGVYGTGQINSLWTVLPIPHAPIPLGFNTHAKLNVSGQIQDIYFDLEPNQASPELAKFTNEIYLTSLNAQGAWSSPAKVPIHHDANMPASAPFFSGSSLTVRLEDSIATAHLNDPAHPLVEGSWGPYVVDLAPGTPTSCDSGQIFVLGEPTRTDPQLTVDGTESLVFAYAKLGPPPAGSTHCTVNIDAGIVQKAQ